MPRRRAVTLGNLARVTPSVAVHVASRRDGGKANDRHLEMAPTVTRTGRGRNGCARRPL